MRAAVKCCTVPPTCIHGCLADFDLPNEAFFVLAEGDANATEIDEGMTLGCNHSAIRNTGPARCSERWSPRVTSAVKRAVVSTGTDVAVTTALTTTHPN
jgi:hypothetical protein